MISYERSSNWNISLQNSLDKLDRVQNKKGNAHKSPANLNHLAARRLHAIPRLRLPVRAGPQSEAFAKYQVMLPDSQVNDRQASLWSLQNAREEISEPELTAIHASMSIVHEKRSQWARIAHSSHQNSLWVARISSRRQRFLLAEFLPKCFQLMMKILSPKLGVNELTYSLLKCSLVVTGLGLNVYPFRHLKIFQAKEISTQIKRGPNSCISFPLVFSLHCRVIRAVFRGNWDSLICGFPYELRHCQNSSYLISVWPSSH